MKTKLHSLILVVTLVGLLLTACSSNKLVGTWVDNTGTTYTFSSDGTLVVGGLIPMTGSYEVLDGGQLVLKMDGLFGLTGGTVYDYQVSGNQLSLTAMGMTTVLTRSK